MALHVLLVCADSTERLTSPALSDLTGYALRTTQLIAPLLVSLGLLESQRGRSGGYAITALGRTVLAARSTVTP